ncbi:MAG: DUF4971 domain-containing protein [Dysgonamonadaceae bacterium]|jgi:chitinase|nr:DUF4971 domain-containing protein [Dysgonamonadaceae bacterium]
MIKKKLIFFILGIVFLGIFEVSCSINNDDEQITKKSYPLTSFSVIIGDSYYYGEIDQNNHKVEIGAIEDPNTITSVDYTLMSAGTTISPDPLTFVGNWKREQIVTVTTEDNKQTAYSIVLTKYDESLSNENPPKEDFMIAGYVTASWITPETDLEFIKYLDRIFFFGMVPDKDGSFIIPDDYIKTYELVRSKMNKNQEILLTVGSGGDVANMHEMGNDPVKREAYVKKLTVFAKEHDFDGIDIDWETNWKVEPYQYVPTENLKALLKSIKEQMPDDAILTTALGRSRASAQQAYDVRDIVDDVSVMLYGALNNEGLHSPLYSVIENLKNFSSVNYPNNELLVGVPFYGMREDKKTIKYKNIVNNLPPGDTSVSVYDGYSFNSVDDMHEKVRYLINGGYKGVMIWETTQDVPFSHPMSLLSAIYKEVNEIK